MKMRAIAAAVLSVAAAGCASDDATGERQRPTERDYVTGSRIPQKDRMGVTEMTREEFERQAEKSSMPKKDR
jgi:hypothetical protein